ncbi:MAG TPA: ATP-binding protein [Burkholderiaceae bacterium]
MSTDTAAAPAGAPAAPTAWWRLVHQRLMPDYNLKAALYWWTVVLLGGAVLSHAAAVVAAMPPANWLQMAFSTVLAMGAGLVPVRIPRSNNSFTAGEIFIFLVLLMHGPEAASLGAACEALVGAWRSSRRWTSRLASPAIAALAMYVAGWALVGGLEGLRRLGWTQDGLVLLGAIGFAIAYFVLSTVMVTMVPRLKRNEPLRWGEFFDAFGWLGVAYSGNASVATLLYLSFRQSGIVVVVAAVPLIVILLTTGHYFFRREEAEEAVRKAQEQQAAQRQLMENARQAGMAEIATNVLHNVGNVLNSINVSADLLSGRARNSALASLERAMQLMAEHEADLGEFLTQDARGRLLPGFLRQVSQALTEERAGMLKELEDLSGSVKHAKQVVATQQSYARGASLHEPMRVPELIEDALRIDAAAIGNSHVRFVRRFDEELPAMLLDKHRLLLILVNLLSNARHAVAGVHETAPEIRLCTERVDAATLRISVSDNGEGIAPENMTRIFAHGFTTRKEGHGFGLHSCALAAIEMGGALNCHSDGPGRGATFTLDLPIKTETTS